MAYKALYRTYRPQKFSEVVGQEAIVRTLQNALAYNKISHAYLFSGPRGTGKTSIARIFAKALNCKESPISEPCGECLSCKEISEGNNPDVVEIDAASNNGVDEIRDIRDKVKFLPSGSKYKVYIIDEVHMLSQGAFNALLKTLEEPPKHVVFILATTEPHKVLPTILSRCQRYDFKSLSVKEIANLIDDVAKKEKFIISEEAIIGIAEAAEGGMRDALSYLDQAASFTDDEITIDDVNSVTGNLNYDKIIELASFFEDKNINQALKTVNDLVIMGKEINKIISGLLQFYRDILLYKNIDTSMFSKYIFEKNEFKKLSQEIDDDKIFYYVDILSEVQTKIKNSSTPNIFLEVAIIKMINVTDNDLNIVNRIKELETKINNYNNLTQVNESVDNNEKLDLLESKLFKVVNELSKLELHKVVDKVNKIEKDILRSNEINENDNNINNNTDLNKIKESIQNIEDELESLRKNNSNNNSDENIKYEFNLIKDKISNIESKLYKIMSGELSNQSTNSKKVKKKINDGQIVLFGDEIVSINDIDKPIKEKVDFEEHQKEAVVNDRLNDDEDDSLDNNEKDDSSDELVIEEDNFDSEYENELNELSVKDFEKSDKEVEYIDKAILDESLEEITLTDFENELTNNNNIKKIKNNSEIIDSPNSQLVRKINKEYELDMPIQSFSDIKKEKDKINEELKKVNDKENISDIKMDEGIKKSQFSLPKDLSNDEFSQYSVSIIERILHNSRTSEARDDKIRIINLWKVLDNEVPKDMLDIADLLQEGQVVAVGDKEFIMTYPNTSLCNQVMKVKFKKESLKLLYDLLGDTYNYIALPDKLWMEKRIEYINQYNIGIRYPKLTPIDDPHLSVEKENQDYMSNQKTIVSKAIELFGENIVKIE